MVPSGKARVAITLRRRGVSDRTVPKSGTFAERVTRENAKSAHKATGRNGCACHRGFDKDETESFSLLSLRSFKLSIRSFLPTRAIEAMAQRAGTEQSLPVA
jgi:hypothetical protein